MKYTPIFEPSRMVKTFKRAYNEQPGTGLKKQAKAAARAAEATIATEIVLMSMI